MTRKSSRTVAWLAGLAALALIGAWLTPSAMTGQTLGGWLAGVAVVVVSVVFAASAYRAWPRSERLFSQTAMQARGNTMAKNRKVNPLVEEGAEADRRAHELPEQPQERIVRGYGAVNPEEGALEERRE